MDKAVRNGAAIPLSVSPPPIILPASSLPQSEKITLARVVASLVQASSRPPSGLKNRVKALFPGLVSLWWKLRKRLGITPPPPPKKKKKERVRQPKTELTPLQRKQRRLCKTYIGITGSCGKSTATHILGRMLRSHGKTKTVVQRNTPTAIMRVLSELRARKDFVVQEISGHRPGVIDKVTNLFRIDVAVVTSIGHDHWAWHKDTMHAGDESLPVDQRYLAAIAAVKGKLVEAVHADGLVCLNADDPWVMSMVARAKARIVTFGTVADAEVRAEEVDAKWPGRLSFTLVIGDTRRRVETRFVGTLMLPSALSALAVLHGLGLDIEQALPVLGEVKPARQRLSVHRDEAGRTFILDTFKAPSWSTRLLIEDLPNIGAGDLTFVLGEISDARNDKGEHYRHHLRAAAGTAAHVVGFGPAANSARRVREQGHGNVHAADTYDEARALLASLPPGPVLLKSSKLAWLYKICEPCEPPATRPAARSEPPSASEASGTAIG